MLHLRCCAAEYFFQLSESRHADRQYFRRDADLHRGTADLFHPESLDGTGIVDFFYYESIPFIRYPITIFPLFMQVILTYILPYAFINFFPAQYFLGKTDFSIFSPMFQYLTPLVGVVAFSISIWFWNWGLKKYQSTGS